MKEIKSFVKIFFAILVFGVAIVSIQDQIINFTERMTCIELNFTDDEFRAKFYSDGQREDINYYKEQCKTILRNVEKDVSYFPVAESSVDKTLKVSFSNSWMSERSFGGERGHEGTDIMASENRCGLYPVVSMTDGTVTNMGWLEKGGYRVGITSESGIYYYYAHLDSYASIKEGQRVKAGELLGFMGDSGYGPEGTVGKFPVHLHVGIYLYEDGREVSVNPYYILCYLENKKLKYAYS